MKEGISMRRFVAEISAAALLFAPISALLFMPLIASPASALTATQDGLVNVYVNNVEVAKNVSPGFAAATVASVCELGNPNIAALASQVDQTDQPQAFSCPSTGGPIWVVQN
jgi:hypothetical protein